MKIRVVLVCALAIGVIAAVICLPRSESPRLLESQRASTPPAGALPGIAENAARPAEPESASPAAPLLTGHESVDAGPSPQLAGEREVPQPSKGPVAVRNKSATAATAPARSPNQGKNYQDLGARAALTFVGADPEAEAYWYDAINDPSLSSHERQDLIEDLNEEGFIDPRHPTVEDLPLIISRLELIEELAPEAMDSVNSDAFAEARKDLLKMAALTPR